jgi:hypothetical protein
VAQPLARQAKESRMMRKLSACLVFAVVLAAVVSLHGVTTSAAPQLGAAFSGGLTLTQTTTANGKTSNATAYFSGNAMKHATAEGQDSIIRFDQGKIVSVDNKKKTYSELTFDELQKMMDQAGAMMNQNPEAMAAMQKLMGGGNQKPLTVTKAGPGETIAGYATEKYVVSGPFDMEIWAAPDLKVPAAYYDTMRLRMPANPIMDMGKMFEAFKQVNGWAMKTTMKMRMMGRDIVTTTEVTSVQKGAVPASTFEVPAGYKLVQEKMK